MQNVDFLMTRLISQGIQRGHFFRVFFRVFFPFVNAIFDLVDDVGAIHGLCFTANSMWKSFLKYV